MSALEGLQGALRAAHDPYTPQHIRAQAYEACEAVKSSFDSAFGAARALLGVAGSDDLSRHFGLLLLDELVTTKWNALSPEQCEALKQTACELVQSVRVRCVCAVFFVSHHQPGCESICMCSRLLQGSRDAVTEQLFVKTKIAKLVVELAKRDWPQRWPTMTTTLLEQAAQRETSCELVLRIVCDLAEAVTEYSFSWPERRRAELQQGLVVTMQQLFALLTHTLSSQSPSVQAQGGPPPNSCVAGTLLQNTLQAIHALVDWISLDIIFAGDTLMQVCSLLGFPHYFLVCQVLTGHMCVSVCIYVNVKMAGLMQV